MKQLVLGAILCGVAMAGQAYTIEQEVLAVNNKSQCRLVLDYQHQVVDKDHKMQNRDWPGRLSGGKAMPNSIESGAKGDIYIGFTEFATQIIDEAQYSVRCKNSLSDVIKIRVTKLGGMKPIVELTNSGRDVIEVDPPYHTLPWQEDGKVNVKIQDGPLLKAKDDQAS